MNELEAIIARRKRLEATVLPPNVVKQIPRRRIGTMVLDHETCDWVIDHERDTAICRTHGEIVDGRGSKHFPGARLTQGTTDAKI